MVGFGASRRFLTGSGKIEIEAQKEIAPPELTVVVATYNRSEVLGETLSCLDRQTVASERFEVIVVDDGSPDDTEQLVASMMDKVAFNLSYLRHENRGPGYTENVGIAAAKAPLLLLIADDIWAHPQLIEEHLALHVKYPQPSMGVFGKVSQSPQLPDTVLHRHWDPFQFERFTDGEEVDGVYFHACNISVKKQFLLENGLFLEQKGAAHEDIELGYRLAKKGFRLVYSERASAVHQHLESIDGICRRAYERGRNFNLLLNSMPASYALPLYKISAAGAGLAARVKMLPREMLRLSLFNGFLVRSFWRPVLVKAEENSLAKLFAHGLSYRGMAGHYLRLGYSDMSREPKQGS